MDWEIVDGIWDGVYVVDVNGYVCWRYVWLYVWFCVLFCVVVLCEGVWFYVDVVCCVLWYLFVDVVYVVLVCEFEGWWCVFGVSWCNGVCVVYGCCVGVGCLWCVCMLDNFVVCVLEIGYFGWLVILVFLWSNMGVMYGNILIWMILNVWWGDCCWLIFLVC